MPRKRSRSMQNKGSLSDRAYSSPGHTKYSHRMLLVKDYENTNSYSATCRREGVHHSTVKLWVKRFEETGDVERSTPPRERTVATPGLLDACHEIIDTANTSSTRGCPSWNFILREVRKRGFTCSRPTVVNFLRDAGIIQRSFSKGLFLTESHKAKRLTFALKMQKWSVAQLRHIIWCDEKKFTCQLGCESRSYICRASDPPKPPLKASQKWFGGDGVNVWMGISFIYGIFYHVFPNRDSNGKITITSDVFKCAMTKRVGFLSFLKRHSGSRVAMDNAPCHNGSFRTFKENEVVVLDFPPKSPDLNPIENIWEIMDAFIKNGTNPENRTELLFSIERAVDYIKTDGHDMLTNTLNSMPRRFDIVVEKKGESCNY